MHRCGFLNMRECCSISYFTGNETPVRSCNNVACWRAHLPLNIRITGQCHRSNFKVMCRDRGVTMLVRVDVCAAEGGVLVINVSHQAAGFTPYRLDNCSSETLHLRQGKTESHDRWIVS